MLIPPPSAENQVVLDRAREWFDDLILRHIANTTKCMNPSEFQVNPFLAPYLSAFLTGEVTRHGIARSMVYPRVLGTSITTSFGTNIQRFITDVLRGYAGGSVTEGLDIEFVDRIDNRRKYAQLKAGPNTLNKDDVPTIDGHFSGIKNRARTNSIPLDYDQLVVGIMYGTYDQVSSHYRKLETNHHYTLFVGQDFWHRLTGDEHFYVRFTETLAGALASVSSQNLIEEVIDRLAQSPEIVELERLWQGL
jgi:Type II restriction endonuclease EcoO109I